MGTHQRGGAGMSQQTTHTVLRSSKERALLIAMLADEFDLSMTFVAGVIGAEVTVTMPPGDWHFLPGFLKTNPSNAEREVLEGIAQLPRRQADESGPVLPGNAELPALADTPDAAREGSPE